MKTIAVRSLLEDRQHALVGRDRGRRRLPAGPARHDRVRPAQWPVRQHGDGARRGPGRPHLDRYQRGSRCHRTRARSSRCSPCCTCPSRSRCISSMKTAPDSVWVATETQGLFLIDEHGTRHLGMADGLPSDWVIAIHEDERGVIWLGTTDGLALWRDGKVISLARFGGPLRETIMQLLEDDAAPDLVHDQQGPDVRAPRSALDALGRRRDRTPDFHVYGLADGLRTAEFDGGNTAAGCRTPDGLLWFPNIRGIVRVDPEHVRTNTLPPPVHIEQVTGGWGAAQPRRRNRGCPGPAAVGISLHGAEPAGAAARRCSGIGSRASTRTGSMRATAAPPTTPGCRRVRTPFASIASNNDGVWNDTGASFRFTLKPHFYQTFWFALLCVLAVVAVAGGLVPPARGPPAASGRRSERASGAAHAGSRIGQCRTAAGQGAGRTRRRRPSRSSWPT